MKHLSSYKKQHKGQIVAALLFYGLMITAHGGFCLETSSDSQAKTEIAPLPANSEILFEYVMDGRPDPFTPFISEKAASTTVDEILPVEETLTGMQLFEPGQLTLVAIVTSQNSNFAMVEDTTGKGYILKTGMEIGRRGIITAINPNEVIIEETAFTRAGKKLTNDIVMLLKKEGEE